MFKLLCVECKFGNSHKDVYTKGDDVVPLSKLGKSHPYETLLIINIIQQRLSMIGYSLKHGDDERLSDNIYLLKSSKLLESEKFISEVLPNSIYSENIEETPLFSRKLLARYSIETEKSFASKFLQEARSFIPGITSEALDFSSLFERLDEETKESLIAAIASKVIRYLIATFVPTKNTCNGFYVPVPVLNLLFQCAAKCCSKMPMAITTDKKLQIIPPVNGDFSLLLEKVRETKILTYTAPEALSFAVVFMGNYSVGPNTLECTIFIAALQLIYPSTIILLRGSDEQRASNGDWSRGQDNTLIDSCHRYVKSETPLPVSEYTNLYSRVVANGEMSEKLKEVLKGNAALMMWEQMNVFFDTLSFAVNTPKGLVIRGLPSLATVLTRDELINLINKFDKPLALPQNNVLFREILTTSYTEQDPIGKEVFVPSGFGDTLSMTKNVYTLMSVVNVLFLCTRSRNFNLAC